MAGTSGRKSFLFFSGGGRGERVNPIGGSSSSSDPFELEESDVWNDAAAPSSDQLSKKSVAASGLKKPIKRNSSGGIARSNMATSLPVNIPDWSRILGDEYKGGGGARGRGRQDGEVEVDVGGDDDRDGDEDEDEDGRLPPHEYLARTRGSSFSVHEGIGRTLKGRDLSRVRNAVWKQIGFED